MARKIMVSLLVLLFLPCGVVQSVDGQSPIINPANYIKILVYYTDPVPIGWWIAPGQNIVQGQGPYSYYLAAWVVAPFSYDCGCSKNSASNPVSLAAGNTYITQDDLRVPGLGGGLSLTRTWNSMWPVSVLTFQNGIFGASWRSTYEERIVMGIDNYIKYIRSDGSVWSFKIASGTTGWAVAAPANIAASLSTDITVNTYYTLTFQNGEQRRFDSTTGHLIAIIDRNGNTTAVAYDSSGRLSTVTDAASRTLTFTYGSSGNLVSGVSSSVGVSLSYSYDSQGRLLQVTKPDLSTLNFSYNSQSLISSVTDSNGKVLEAHTYDSQGRGLTASRANGIEAVALSYSH